MKSMARKRQRGFTLIELIITVGIVAILGSIALAQMRDYTRRARITEVMLALSRCKNVVTENFLTLDTAPPAGRWGCEGGGGSYYAGSIQTSSEGTIRVPVANLDSLVNGHYIYLIPAHANGVNPMIAPADLGKGIGTWICGSDWSPVRNSLPVNCRADTTTLASQDFL